MNNPIVIDSSVFLSAFWSKDVFTEASETFFRRIPTDALVILPSLVIAEVLVNVAKQNPLGIKEALAYLSHFRVVDLTLPFLHAIIGGMINVQALKTSDFIIAATAKLHQATLITWDKRLLAADGLLCPIMKPSDYIASVS